MRVDSKVKNVYQIDVELTFDELDELLKGFELVIGEGYNEFEAFHKALQESVSNQSPIKPKVMREYR